MNSRYPVTARHPQHHMNYREYNCHSSQLSPALSLAADLLDLPSSFVKNVYEDFKKEHQLCSKDIEENKKTHLDPKTSKKGKLNLASPALHPEMISLLAAVAEMSVEKGYKPLNWLDKDSPVTVMYCLNASDRHKQKVKLGIDYNTEEKKLDGTPVSQQVMHLAQSAYNDLMAALLLLKKGDKADDRAFKDGELK